MTGIESPDHHWRLAETADSLTLSVMGEVLSDVDESFASRALAVCENFTGQRVTIDFSGCRNLASSGLGFLVRFNRIIEARGLKVEATGVCTRVANLLNVLGLHKFMRQSA